MELLVLQFDHYGSNSIKDLLEIGLGLGPL